MKLISRFLNTIAGVFRIFVTLAFLWGIVFTFFVDRDLLTAFYDLLGFDSVSPEIIKIITAIIFAFAFFINVIVARHIFKANKTGQHHMSNMFFGFVFLLIDFGIYFFTREEKLFYLFMFSGILILGSLFGLGAKAKGLYPKKDTPDFEELPNEDTLNKDNTSSEAKSEEEEEKEVEAETDDENSDGEDGQETLDQKPEEVKEDTKEDIEEENLEKDKEEVVKESSNPKNQEASKDLEQAEENSLEENSLEEDQTSDATYDKVPSEDLDETKDEEVENSSKTENTSEQTDKREEEKE